MIEFNKCVLSIRQILQYTYKYFNNRFDYYKRDILKTKITIKKVKQYKRNKEGKTSTPSEMLFISTKSAPQYKPYTNHLKSDNGKQMKYKHEYNHMIAIQPNEYNNYTLDSKIIWRTGSMKKWESDADKIGQSELQCFTPRTKENIKKKKLSKTEIEKLKKRYSKNKYVSVGDFNAQERGIFGDDYYHNYTVQQKFCCLYGKNWEETEIKDRLPFFNKHILAVIIALVKKGVILTSDKNRGLNKVIKNM